MQLYPHADVLIAPVDAIPAAAQPSAGLILARGEMTGRAHRVETEAKAELFALGQELFLRVLDAPARVTHEEHKPIESSPGTYRVWRQREYDPLRNLTVSD